MAATEGRVVYRSPDALQNLRVRVALTRISAPRADNAVEERLAGMRAPGGRARNIFEFLVLATS